jgi:predicted PurR-regulated permease PerM
LLRGILLPFVAAFILAYLLNPLANRMDRVGVGRLSATLAIALLPLAIATAHGVSLPVSSAIGALVMACVEGCG